MPLAVVGAAWDYLSSSPLIRLSLSTAAIATVVRLLRAVAPAPEDPFADFGASHHGLRPVGDTYWPRPAEEHALRVALGLGAVSGRVVLLTGPNLCGRSTLMRAVPPRPAKLIDLDAAPFVDAMGLAYTLCSTAAKTVPRPWTDLLRVVLAAVTGEELEDEAQQVSLCERDPHAFINRFKGALMRLRSSIDKAKVKSFIVDHPDAQLRNVRKSELGSTVLTLWIDHVLAIAQDMPVIIVCSSAFVWDSLLSIGQERMTIVNVGDLNRTEAAAFFKERVERVCDDDRTKAARLLASFDDAFDVLGGRMADLESYVNLAANGLVDDPRAMPDIPFVRRYLDSIRSAEAFDDESLGHQQISWSADEAAVVIDRLVRSADGRVAYADMVDALEQSACALPVIVLRKMLRLGLLAYFASAPPSHQALLGPDGMPVDYVSFARPLMLHVARHASPAHESADLNSSSLMM